MDRESLEGPRATQATSATSLATSQHLSTQGCSVDESYPGLTMSTGFMLGL